MSEQSLIFRIYYKEDEKYSINRDVTKNSIETFRKALVEESFFVRTIQPLNPDLKSLTPEDAQDPYKYFPYVFRVEFSLSSELKGAWGIPNPTENSIELKGYQRDWRVNIRLLDLSPRVTLKPRAAVLASAIYNTPCP